MSSLFVRTLRDDPADAEVPSHRLLLRAGYIRRAAPGIYTWLPLGLKVLRRIEAIIREEMDAIGAQELTFPALLPREPYEATGRWTDYGDGIFRLKDRKGNDYLLGPTHEEMFTLVVKDLYSSYKDLPVWLYQIQTKYRDEARPRAGLIRGREFVMKDSYSFDVSDAGLDASYAAHREAYIRTFDRLGFDYVIVKATSGAMGGSRSEEFLAKSAELNRRGMLQLLEGFRGLGLTWIPSAGNFVTVRVGNAASVNARLLKQGVIVRPIGGYGMPEWLRVSIGLPEENARFLDALRQALD